MRYRERIKVSIVCLNNSQIKFSFEPDTSTEG